jgi:hypothetical protein
MLLISSTRTKQLWKRVCDKMEEVFVQWTLKISAIGRRWMSILRSGVTAEDCDDTGTGHLRVFVVGCGDLMEE